MAEQNKQSFDFKAFLELRKHLGIAHHVPGRIRLRIKLSAIKALADMNKNVLDDTLLNIEGIQDFRINKMVGSVVISYTTQKIQPDWWECLLQGDAEEALSLLRKLIDQH